MKLAYCTCDIELQIVNMHSTSPSNNTFASSEKQKLNSISNVEGEAEGQLAEMKVEETDSCFL